MHAGRSLTEHTTPDAVLIQLDLLIMSTVCSKHVEDYNNKRIIQGLSKRFERFKFGIFYILIVKIRYNFTHK